MLRYASWPVLFKNKPKILHFRLKKCSNLDDSLALTCCVILPNTSADHYCQLLNIICYCCWKPVSAFVLGVEDGIYPLLQSSSVGAGSNKANGGSNGQSQAGGGANSVGSARQQQQQQQQQPQQQSQQGSKPVECNLCHRTFKNIPALNGHMRLHGGYFKKVRTRCNISVY